MVRHPTLGELTPNTWQILRATLVEADMASEGWFSATDIVRLLSLTEVTEQDVRELFATLVQNEWMVGPVDLVVDKRSQRFYRLTELGETRIRALFVQ